MQKLSSHGAIVIEEMYDVLPNVFGPMDQDKHLHHSRAVTVEEMRQT